MSEEARGPGRPTKYDSVVIYALRRPGGPIRYVGKTNNLTKRSAEHVREARAGHKAARHVWIRGLLQSGIMPETQVLERCSPRRWRERERYWIKSLRRQGADLLNRTKGGDAMCDFSPVVRLHRKVRNMFGGDSPATKVFGVWLDLCRESPEGWGEYLNQRAENLLERGGAG